MRLRSLLPLAGLLLVVACGPTRDGPPLPPTDPPTPSLRTTPGATASTSASATPIGLPSSTPAATPAVGLPSEGCVNGWLSPMPDSVIGGEGVALLAAYMGLQTPLEVVDMRYFTGPDVAWIIEPHYEVVERWYIKATLADDPTYRGRWLLEKRSEMVKGVSAVAPFDSAGYASPDWSGFVGDGSPTIYPGLPGAWSGIRYDFVTGEGDSGQPGLPVEVDDCLAGT